MKKVVQSQLKSKRKKVRKNNPTHNFAIPLSIQKREIIEYGAGILPKEHDLYLGERL